MKPAVVCLSIALWLGASANGHAQPKTLSVASYNLNLAMAGNPKTVKAIRDLGVDVVLLQEVGTKWRDSLKAEFASTYPHLRFHSKNLRWGGLAILSKYPIRVDRKLPPTVGPFPAWITTLDTPMGLVQLLNVHLFPPVRWIRRYGVLGAYEKSQAVHLKEMRSFVQHLDPALPTLIVGDLNEAANGKAVQWLKKRGFVSAIRGATPTWRWKTKVGMFRWQMDHILHDANWKVVRSKVVGAGASDHLPVVAFLRGSAAAAPR